ncbi:MAG: DUF4384 domain-containing protein [Blastocatellia bacterium]
MSSELHERRSLEVNRMKTICELLIISFLFALQIPSPALTQENDEERDMIKKYESGAAHGMKVTILQRSGDSLTAVDPKNEFKKGDRIRVEIESNFAGFVYMINVGSSGKTTIIFPDRAEDNRIMPGRRYTLPTSYDLEFDENSGVDVFKVLMSLRPVPLLTSAARRGNGELSSNDLKTVSDLIARSERQQAGIISSEFNLNNKVGGLKAVGTREPLWNEKKKAALVTVKQQNKTNGKLQTGQVAVFGIQFRNLGSVK